MTDQQLKDHIKGVYRELSRTRMLRGERVPTSEFRSAQALGRAPDPTALVSPALRGTGFDYLSLLSQPSLTLESVQRQAAQDQSIREDEAMQALHFAMLNYGRDPDSIEVFRDYGGAASAMGSMLSRIERKQRNNQVLTAEEEAATRDPERMLYLLQTYGTLRGQAAQDHIADINLTDQQREELGLSPLGTGESGEMAGQERRALYPEIYGGSERLVDTLDQ